MQLIMQNLSNTVKERENTNRPTTGYFQSGWTRPWLGFEVAHHFKRVPI